MVNDFADSLMANNDVANAKNARTKAQALLDFMNKELIVHNRAVGLKYANAFGLAGYLPSYYTSSYDELIWAKDSKWDEMMKWINGKRSR